MKSFFKFRCHLSKIIKSSIIAIIIVSILMVIDGYQEMRPPDLTVLISMTSSVNSAAQLFYDVGKGLNEKDSKIVNVYKSKKFQTLQFTLPTDKIYYLRFDPIRVQGSFAIKSVKIGDAALKTNKVIDLKSIEVLQQIKKFKIKKNLAVGVTKKNAYDPILYFDIDYPIRSSGINYISDYFKTVPHKAAVMFILSFTGMLFAFYDDDPESTHFTTETQRTRS